MKPRFLIVCVVAFVVAGCGGKAEPEIDPVSLDDLSLLPAAADLKLNRTQAVPYGSGSIALTVKEIRDSRCPKGVNCIRAGEGVVVVEASLVSDTGSTPGQELMLSTAADGPTTWRRFAIRLTGLDPYPVHGSPVNMADYTAAIEVVEAAR